MCAELVEASENAVELLVVDETQSGKHAVSVKFYTGWL